MKAILSQMFEGQSGEQPVVGVVLSQTDGGYGTHQCAGKSPHDAINNCFWGHYFTFANSASAAIDAAQDFAERAKGFRDNSGYRAL